MIRKQSGFTLVELMITMVIFVLVIAAASNIFTGILTQFKQQSKIAESNIQGIAGLEILRFDLEQSGYGLPWAVDADGNRQADTNWTGLSNYREAVSAGVPNPANYNDANTATGTNGNAPRAVVAGNNVVPVGVANCVGANQALCSDYLVVKALNVATSAAAIKWSYVSNTGSTTNTYMTATGAADEDLVSGERVIVVLPSGGSSQRILLTDAGAFFTTLTAANAPSTGTTATFPANLKPLNDSYGTNIIYGVDSNSNLQMPFNRADYYIATTSVPARCATGTGVLTKAILNNNIASYGAANGGGSFPGTSRFALLDCVVNMQVTFRLDMNDDGAVGTTAAADGSTISTSEAATVATVQATLADAALLRQRLKEIRVYVVAHEGQTDPSYTGPANITATDAELGDVINYDASAAGTRNFRWKAYQLIVTPYNLR